VGNLISVIYGVDIVHVCTSDSTVLLRYLVALLNEIATIVLGPARRLTLICFRSEKLISKLESVLYAGMYIVYSMYLLYVCMQVYNTHYICLKLSVWGMGIWEWECICIMIVQYLLMLTSVALARKDFMLYLYNYSLPYIPYGVFPFPTGTSCNELIVQK